MRQFFVIDSAWIGVRLVVTRHLPSGRRLRSQLPAGGAARRPQAGLRASNRHHGLAVVAVYNNLHSQDHIHKPTATMGVPFEALLPYGIMVSCAD
jgi:hypothetical protein